LKRAFATASLLRGRGGGALSFSNDVSQGTGIGRGIIAGISLQAISHISLAMMAGSQNNIGMVNLLCDVTLQRRPVFRCSQSFQDL
jgi:hypothetical protein